MDLGTNIRKLQCQYLRTEDVCILKVLNHFDLQANELKKIIEDMAGQSLRCIGFAYRNLDLEDVPREEQRISWQLPDNDLTFIGIAGMKVHVQEFANDEFCCIAYSSSSSSLLVVHFPMFFYRTLAVLK